MTQFNAHQPSVQGPRALPRPPLVCTTHPPLLSEALFTGTLILLHSVSGISVFHRVFFVSFTIISLYYLLKCLCFSPYIQYSFSMILFLSITGTDVKKNCTHIKSDRPSIIYLVIFPCLCSYAFVIYWLSVFEWVSYWIQFCLKDWSLPDPIL